MSLFCKLIYADYFDKMEVADAFDDRSCDKQVYCSYIHCYRYYYCSCMEALLILEAESIGEKIHSLEKNIQK